MDVLTKAGFNRDYFNNLALSTKFIKRVRKLSGADYFTILVLNAANSIMSYNAMAGTFLGNINKSINKQAIHKAFQKIEFEYFFDKIFNDIFFSRAVGNINTNKFSFKRIVIQDSTILKIPSPLFGAFSGVSNGLVKVANCRIQLAIDIISNSFTYFSVDSYSKNDLLAAPKLIIKMGDLVLRDRGYFVVAEINRIIKSGAFFISRLYNGVKYYDLQGQEINLVQELKKTKTTRIKVRIGNPSNEPVILYAVRIKESVANERRRKAKNTAKGKRIEDKTLQLFSWQIYLTNIDDEAFSMEDIYNLYSLRWRIEIIFKGLKSHCNLSGIHQVPEKQLKLIIRSRILLIILITKFIYQPIKTMIEKEKEKNQISYLQLVSFLTKNIQMLEIILTKTRKRTIDLKDPIINSLCQYCKYTKKNKIDHFEKRLLNCLS